MRRGAILVGAALLFAVPVSAMAEMQTSPVPAAALQGDQKRFAEGVAAYDRGDYKTALDIWLPLARAQDLAAQRNVAHMFRKGLGTEVDLPRALYFYEAAGRAGLATAQLNAAFMHLKGEGTAVDQRKAAYWFDLAARAGLPIAEYNLGVMYETGQGVEKNLALALGWYQRAARAGHPEALERLALLVDQTPPPNQPQSEPAPQSPSGPGTASKPAAAPSPVGSPTPAPPAPIASAPRLVTPDQGARFMRGRAAYDAGDFGQAADIWAPLAEEGVREAQYRYGQLLAFGLGRPRNERLAYQWYGVAAAQGHEGAREAAEALAPLLSDSDLAAADQAIATFTPSAKP